MNVAALNTMGASSSNTGVKTGLIRRTLTLFDIESYDNAELSEEQDSSKCVETIHPVSQSSGLVICQLCGRKFKRITHFHTECKHSITIEQYKRLFPYACIEGKLWREGQRTKRLAQETWNKGLTRSDPRVAKYVNQLVGRAKSREHCREISRTKREKCKSPRYALETVSNIKVIARNVRPTKPEQRMMAMLDRYFPKQWKYVGNGDLALGRLVPDFMNINGKKQLIEVYGDYWHKGSNPQDRIDCFERFGYSTLVIWESELKNESQALEKLKQFVGDNDIVRASAKVEEQLVLEL